MKITITPDKVKAANVTREMFRAQFDTTGKSRGEVASILLDLAARLEGQDSIRERADALRAKIAARHADLALSPEVNLEPSHDDVLAVHGSGGESLGVARFFEESPAPVWRKPAKAKKKGKKPARRRAEELEDDGEVFGDWTVQDAVDSYREDINEPIWDSAYEEDDAVEFFHRQKWKAGYIVGQVAHDEYEIEDAHGQRVCVPVEKIRI